MTIPLPRMGLSGFSQVAIASNPQEKTVCPHSAPYHAACAAPVLPPSNPLPLRKPSFFLRVDGTTEDTLITTLISVAREAAEQYMQRSLITQTWEISYNDTAPNPIPLAMRPVQSITSVVSDSTTLDPSLYNLNAAKDALICDAGLFGNLITITYSAGYGSNAANIPTPIKHAILTHVASLYDDRSQEAMPSASVALLQPYREVRL